jgi:hypothetical protein
MLMTGFGISTALILIAVDENKTKTPAMPATMR